LGLGLRHFSMSPMLIPAVKDILRKTSLAQARELVDAVMCLGSGSEVFDLLKAK